MNRTRNLARRHLDNRLAEVPVARLDAPARGWIATIREALGMSTRELGRRMGTSGQRVSKLEHDEPSGAIQLSTLQRAAEAMNCRVVYALIPNEPLQELVRLQARVRALESVTPVVHSMHVEDQGVDNLAVARQIDELAAEFIDKRGLWSE